MRIIGFARVFYGCANKRFESCGSVLDVCRTDDNFPQLETHGGIRATETVELLKEFYRCEIPNAPNPKPNKVGRKLIFFCQLFCT
jgi:tRNA-specific adenosine deaminase 2